MRNIRLLLAVALLSSPLAAQSAAPGLEIGADLSYWQLDFGNATVGSTTRPSGTVRAAVLIPSRLMASLGLSATYAGEDGTAPGLLAFNSEFAQRLYPRQPDGLNFFLAAGAGLLRFSSDEQRRIIDECLADSLCMYEGPSHRENWRTVLTASAGLDVGLVRGVLMQPVLMIVKPYGAGDGQEVMFRLGMGLAWRPVPPNPRKE